MRLGSRHRREILAFLRRQPAQNVYILGQIARGALTRDDVAGPVVGYRPDGELEGICICGSNLVISSPCSHEALAFFANYARRGRYKVRVAIGEDELLSAFMDYYGRVPGHIVLERARQLLFEVRRESLDPDAVHPGLRPAELEELGHVIDVDRAMVTEELGFDPFVADAASYRAGWRRRIREGRAFVVGPVGDISFKLELSAVGDEAVQISGVYTLPDQRRRGLGRAGVGEASRRLLQDVERVTLYVNRENRGAIRLYERLGFRRVGRVRSVWFE